MEDERERLRGPGRTGPTADDALTLDPIPERGLPNDDPIDRMSSDTTAAAAVGTDVAHTEFGGGRVGGDADFDPDTSGFVGQAGAGTDDVGSDRRAAHDAGGGGTGLDAGARGAAGGALGAVGGIIVGGVVAGPPGALIGGVVGAVGGAVVGGATADELEGGASTEGGASDDDEGRTIDRGSGASE